MEVIKVKGAMMELFATAERRAEVQEGFDLAARTVSTLTSGVVRDIGERDMVNQVLNAALRAAESQFLRDRSSDRIRDPEAIRTNVLQRTDEILTNAVSGSWPTGEPQPIAPERPSYAAAARLLHCRVELENNLNAGNEPATLFNRGWLMALSDVSREVTRYVRPPENQEQVFEILTTALFEARGRMQDVFTGPNVNTEDVRAEIRFQALQRIEERFRHPDITVGWVLPELTDQNREYFQQAWAVLDNIRMGRTHEPLGPMPARTR